MKKFYLLILIVSGSLGLQAQYKKASFLTKSGRTYDLSFTAHLLPDDRSMVPGIAYSYGRDNGKRTFYWFDLELLLPANFTYQSLDQTSLVPVTVSGKSKLGLQYRYNFGVFLANIKDDPKFKPFATAGLNFLILGGTAKPESVKYNPEFFYPQEVLSTQGFSFGLNAGLGFIYNFASKVGVKVTGGYNYQKQISIQSVDGTGDEAVYEIFPSHPYVSVGIHFALHDD